MPRRGQIAKRDVLPDPMYNSKLVTRLINNIMYDGKKGVAQKIVYGAFEIVNEKTGKDALEAFKEALENIMPVLEVKARRIGGATYQVPMEVRPARRQTLGLRWLTNYSRARSEKTMKERSLMQSMVPAVQLKNVRILTRWLKQTKLSHITDSNQDSFGSTAPAQRALYPVLILVFYYPNILTRLRRRTICQETLH